MKFLILETFLATIFLTSRASWNISRNGFLLNTVTYSGVRNSDYFSVVFWGRNQNGILLYAYGRDNYILVELYHGVIRASLRYIGRYQQEPYVGYVGSGLADNNPHQIEVYRQSNSVLLVLDRGSNQEQAAWPFIGPQDLVFVLKKVYIGGYKNYQWFDRLQSLSKTSFIGCIEKAIWNNVNLLYRPYANESVPFCELSTFTPITFLTPQSFITLDRKDFASGFSLVFQITLYLNYTTLLFHKDGVSTLNISISDGSFFMSLDYGDSNYINAFLPQVKLNDGSWHQILVQLPGKNSLEVPVVVFGVDDEIVSSVSSFTYDTTKDIKFGGHGFVGCINNLTVDGIKFKIKRSTRIMNVTTNGCHFSDMCVPNPCQHFGYCSLKGESFDCMCPKSYPGTECSDALYYTTCSHMYSCGIKNIGMQRMDVDGVGPLDPVPVKCGNMEAYTEKQVITQIDNLLNDGKVVISNEPSTINIDYPLSAEELQLFVLNSDFCSQQVKYICTGSKIVDGNNTLVVWTGANGLTNNYWNSYGVYGACQCYVDRQSCNNENSKCNCDGSDMLSRTDSVIFRIKEDLPIMSITAMDISSASGNSATIEVGPLICSGIGGKNNAVTFQEIFSYLPLPDINFASPGTIQFEFKTDRAQGNVIIFVQGRPNTEYYVIELTNLTTITVYMSDGVNQYTLSVSIPSLLPLLNNLDWHKVYFKVTATTLTLSIDGILKSIKIEYNYLIPIEVNKDNTPFYLGGSPYNQFSGFRGTIQRLFINGVFINLLEKTQKVNLSPSGVHTSIYSACISSPNPCNYGDCLDHFNYYICDCSNSPYYGKNCENEVGVIFNSPSSSLTYYIKKQVKIVYAYISISFATNKDGLLYLIQGQDPNIFVLLDVYQGAVRLSFNLFPQRVGVPDTFTLTSKQYPHLYNDGKNYVAQLKLEVNQITVIINGIRSDLREPISIPTKYILENPRWVYLGDAPPIKNYPMTKFSQFSGCLGGMKIKFIEEGKVEYEVIDVIKATGGSDAKMIGSGVRTGKCVGNLTAAPPARLIPTPQNMYPISGVPKSQLIGSNGTVYSIGNSWKPVIVGLIILLSFMLILAGILFLRWYSRNHGTYVTQEGAKLSQSAYATPSDRKEKATSALPNIGTDDMDGWYL